MSKLSDGFYPQFCMDDADDGGAGGGSGDWSGEEPNEAQPNDRRGLTDGQRRKPRGMEGDGSERHEGPGFEVDPRR